MAIYAVGLKSAFICQPLHKVGDSCLAARNALFHTRKHFGLAQKGAGIEPVVLWQTFADPGDTITRQHDPRDIVQVNVLARALAVYSQHCGRPATWTAQ